MKFSVIHPTARVNRSFDNWWAVSMIQWWRNCDLAREVEYIVIVHESRIAAFWEELASPPIVAMPEWGRFTVVVNHGRDCVVDQCNEGLKAATGEILIGTMDDLFAPEHWDTRLAAFIPDTSKPVALHCLTGSKRDNQIFNPACETKVLRDLLGPICPEYEGMFVDDEYTLKIKHYGVVVETGVKFEHYHPIFGTAKFDPVYELQNRKESYEVGRRVFEKRWAAGFPRVDLPGFPKPSAVSASVALPEPRRIALCLPGEHFRFEWLAGLVDLCSRLGNENWQVKMCFGYTTSPYHTRINLTEDVLNTAAQGFKPEYVFWLDDDNLIKPDDFMRLVSFLDANPAADTVSGWCWIRQKNRWAVSCGMFAPGDQVHMALFELPQLFETGKPRLMEVGGLPSLLMRFEVLARLGAAAFLPVTKADLPALLGDLPRDGEPTELWFSGEDVSFFLNARKAGMACYVDPACKVAHLKFISQEPDVQLYRDSPQPLVDLREKLNGPVLQAPSNYEEVLNV